eukprot:SM000153S01611  [mRNA]  locus=s153:312102:312413:+ [translate_table: standard]
MDPPGPTRYVLGALVMMLAVVLPLGYMMFKNKRSVPAPSMFAKQTVTPQSAFGPVETVASAAQPSFL